MESKCESSDFNCQRDRIKMSNCATFKTINYYMIQDTNYTKCTTVKHGKIRVTRYI